MQGEVQGVGYRWFTVQRATELGLTGTVENLDDGSVEVFAWGDADKLGRLEDMLKNGPSASSVSKVKRAADPDTPAPPTFSIRR